MKPFKVSYKAKNVNSKKLFEQIHSQITSVVNEYITTTRGLLDSSYDYSQLAEFTDVFMEELLQEKAILQYDVICDDRNNDPFVVRKGVINMTIKFVQWDCLNTTQIEYVFQK